MGSSQIKTFHVFPESQFDQGQVLSKVESIRVFFLKHYYAILPLTNYRNNALRILGKRPISLSEVSYSNTSTQCFTLVLIPYLLNLKTYIPII